VNNFLSHLPEYFDTNQSGRPFLAAWRKRLSPSRRSGAR
jgi:hypothetical protein